MDNFPIEDLLWDSIYSPLPPMNNIADDDRDDPATDKAAASGIERFLASPLPSISEALPSSATSVLKRRTSILPPTPAVQKEAPSSSFSYSEEPDEAPESHIAAVKKWKHAQTHTKRKVIPGCDMMSSWRYRCPSGRRMPLPGDPAFLHALEASAESMACATKLFPLQSKKVEFQGEGEPSPSSSPPCVPTLGKRPRSPDTESSSSPPSTSHASSSPVPIPVMVPFRSSTPHNSPTDPVLGSYTDPLSSPLLPAPALPNKRATIGLSSSDPSMVPMMVLPNADIHAPILQMPFLYNPYTMPFQPRPSNENIMYIYPSYPMVVPQMSNMVPMAPRADAMSRPLITGSCPL
eukprot:TRINITY_DN453_c0_g1_i4.p1 TRINITY_DN453_c0_g1~~TRINITY_DN453_c0_g1_i4.p1  ORF type:complete len:349 (-),score=94.72 TRINITY_DN453_c0_g1_i4:112-1158(-)